MRKKGKEKKSSRGNRFGGKRIKNGRGSAMLNQDRIFGEEGCGTVNAGFRLDDRKVGKVGR